jgi:hypothetical protein
MNLHSLFESMSESWSQKYKDSINCSHPKGFSQKAHCAGKKKHDESVEMEMTCPDCGMCETHGNLNEIKKGQPDANGYTRCWPGKHAVGTKKGKNGGQVRNCKPNESQGVAEGLSQTLRKVVPGYAKREIDQKMDAEKFGRTDVDRDANFHRYKKIQDKIKNKGVAEAQTDYQKRRQRERDVDAGKPVKRQPKNPQNDYFARRKKERDLAESRLYYNVIGTTDKELRTDFGMRKDRQGWYLKESSNVKYKMMAQRAFGSPKLQEYNFPAGQATKGSDNVISPVGSVPRNQINKK